MISYAQNFEDVMLMRALSHITRGTYIDVGACDPIIDSVSLAFYQRGWRGVHVEPVPEYARRLRELRPDDRVVEAAVGKDGIILDFFQFGDTGLSTGVERIAEIHAKAGLRENTIKVQSVSLASILKDFETSDVHWLKIDVEGMEAEVLQSWGTSSVRPWIIVIESTAPNSQTKNHADWDHELKLRDYIFVYFDGLNRFYLHKSQYSLRRHFGAPPNFFDRFVISENSPFAGHLLERTQLLNAQITEKAEALGVLRQEIDEKSNELGLALSELDIKASEIGQLRAHLSDKADQIGLMQVSLSEKTARLGELQAALEATEIEREQIKVALEAGQAAQRALSSELGAVQQIARVAADRLNVAEQAIVLLESGRAANLDAIAKQASTIADMQREQARLIAHIAWQDARLEEVWRSASWRLTEPMRALRRTVHRASAPLLQMSKGVARRGAARGLALVRSQPGLKAPVLAALTVMPLLKRRLLRFAAQGRSIEARPEVGDAPPITEARVVPPWSGSLEDDVAIAMEVLQQGVARSAAGA